MRIRRTLLALSVAGVAAFGVAACGDDNSSSGGSSSSDEASVSFVSPEDGATVSDPVTAEVELSGFEINADAVGKSNVDGEGHLHFSLDGGKYDTPEYSGANGDLAKQLGVDGQYSPATETTITYEGLPKGEHTPEVYLVNNDHSETGTEATTTFTVE